MFVTPSCRHWHQSEPHVSKKSAVGGVVECQSTSIHRMNAADNCPLNGDEDLVKFEPGYDAFPDVGVFRETQTTLHPDYRGVVTLSLI